MSGLDLQRRIALEEIQPLPRAWFVARFTFIWLLLVFCLVAALLAGSLAFRLGMQDGAWLAFLPLRLGFLSLSFMAGALLLQRHTLHGYRIPAWRAGALGAGGILLLCLLLELGQCSAALERYMEKASPAYQALVEDHRLEWWDAPESGRLAGWVLAAASDMCWLQDEEGRVWKVEDGEARWSLERRAGDRVRLRGAVMGDSLFKAGSLDAWEAGPSFSNSHWFSFWR